MVKDHVMIVKAFVECGKNGCFCDKCVAHKQIDETESKSTFCELLSTYRSRLQDKINEVIEKN
jgi:hypothetical protein